MRDIAPMHPQAKRCQDIIAELEANIVPPVPIAEMRALTRRRSARLAADPPVVGRIVNEAIDTPTGPVPVRFYYPSPNTADQLPALVYCHGGGFAVGDLDTVNTICSSICRDAGIVVVSVDYRLAPEHKFPAGLDDTIGVVWWVGRYGRERGIDPTRLAIGGDSAGANLATVAAGSISGDDVALRYQVLVYPVTDMTCSQPSYIDLGTGYPLTRARMENYIRLYLEDPAGQVADARVSPLLATALARQPPALVVVAGLDPLVDEGVAYGERLQKAGIAAEIIEIADHPHGFLGWTRECAAARNVLAHIAQRLSEHLHA
jgi:acetyl esterase